MDRLNVSDLKSALDGEGLTMDIISNKMNPLKTTKQRNTTNNHRKSQQHQRSNNVLDVNNSTDEEDRVSPKGENNNNNNNHPTVSGAFVADEEGFRRCEGDNENTTNNDEQSGFVDSENENITDRLCCLAKLSLHIDAGAATTSASVVAAYQGKFSGAPCSAECTSNTTVPIPSTSKARSLSYPSVAESDSVNDIISSSSKSKSQHFQPLASQGCPGATTGEGDAASETMDDNLCSRRYRRRRRRGHNTNTKRMAVDASTADNGKLTKRYTIRPAECPGPSTSSGGSHGSKKFNKIDNTKNTDSLDSFGMKRKRTITASRSVEDDSNMEGDMDFGALSLNTPVVMNNDQEMKSYEDDDEYSSFESDDEKDIDQGREADDEQSDWVFDEWSSNSKKSQEETASSRKKRLMKMLRSYNTMISKGAGSLSSNDAQTREIRAGRRRVFITKPGFPAQGIWTSANEEVSKFLQDPLQSQIRLQPVSVEEGVQIGHLASLYSLRMDYDETEKQMEDQEDVAAPTHEEETDPSGLKLFPVLTKTPNTTQMDKIIEPSVSSPFNAEGSSSSNVSSVYGPTFSDADSKAGDSKRIKK